MRTHFLLFLLGCFLLAQGPVARAADEDIENLLRVAKILPPGEKTLAEVRSWLSTVRGRPWDCATATATTRC